MDRRDVMKAAIGTTFTVSSGGALSTSDGSPPPCPRKTPKECRFADLGGTTTLMGWTPVYDRAGDRIDHGDPNKTTITFKCLVCGLTYSKIY